MEKLENKNKNDEIDLMKILRILASKWMFIVITAVVLAGAAFIYFNFVVTPRYTSTARIMVINRQNSDSLTSTDLNSSTTLSSDYVEIVKSRTVLEQVIANLDLKYSVGELKGMVSASIVNNTRMISIKVTDKDPILAKEITDDIATVTSERICEVMKVENMVSLVDSADLPTTPSSPATKRNTVIALLLGVVISSAVIIIIGIKDDRIKTQEDVEKISGMSVLGLIPKFEGEGDK